jgi:hypothetical protein
MGAAVTARTPVARSRRVRIPDNMQGEIPKPAPCMFIVIPIPVLQVVRRCCAGGLEMDILNLLAETSYVGLRNEHARGSTLSGWN